MPPTGTSKLTRSRACKPSKALDTSTIRSRPASRRSGPEAGGEPQGEGKKGKDEGPIIDAEVVDEKK
jgi:hypothetical protein